MHGALRPNLVLVETTIDGKKCKIPYSLQELWNLSRENNFFPLTNSGVDENGIPCLTPLPTPEPDEEIPYQQLANALSKLPQELTALEKLSITNLSQYVQFDFESERPICLADIAPDDYTQIRQLYIPANINLEITQPTNPFSRFYHTIIKAEMARVKLALIKFAEVSKSDIDIRGAVKDTLTQINSYSKAIINQSHEMTFMSFEPLREVSEQELKQQTIDNNIYLVLKQYLIKLYFEIVLMFKSILKENDYQSFDDYIFQCFGNYPTTEQNNAYKYATLIQQAQTAIAENQSQQKNIILLAQLYKAIETSPTAEPLKTVTVALENFVFLQHIQQPVPTFEQLINEHYVKSIFHDTKVNINAQILPLTNPREVQLQLDEIRNELPALPPCTFRLDSIPRQLNEWLQKQLQICETNIAQSFIPVATSTKTSTNIKTKQHKTATSQLKTKAHKRLDFLSGCNLHDEKIMSDEDYISLLGYVDEFITNGQIPQNITTINTYTTIEYLRYTFYLIYKDLNLKNPTRAEWVDLLHAVFSQFENTEIPTTNKKFSTKPNLYESDTKTIIKNKR